MRIDIVKEYWNRQPCNIKHSNFPIGTLEYFNEVEKRKYFVEPHIPQFAEFEKWKGLEVLEVGCGIGTDSINFSRAGAKLTSLDLAENNISITKKRFETFNLKANFILGNAEELSSYFSYQQFDLVYSFGVLHHTPHPNLALDEIFKVLKPGGELRIMLYSKYSLKNFLILLGRAQPETQPNCPIAFTYSKKEAAKLLEKFEQFECQKMHIFPYQLKEYKKLNYVKKFPWNITPPTFFRFLERRFGWHLLIKAKKPIL